jgi:hypothetical protein
VLGVAFFGTGSGNVPASGFSVDISGYATSGASAQNFSLLALRNGALYGGQLKISFADIRPTTVIPTGLALTDLFDGTVKATVTNISSIALTDMLVIYDAAGNQRANLCRQEYQDATDRKLADCIIIPGVPLSAMTGWYAKYTSDLNTYSAASAVATAITPVNFPTLPSITGLDILTVDLAGLVEITITGLGLTGFSVATVGGTACTGITPVSDTSAKCTVPAKAAGTYNLAITTAYGMFTLNKALTYGDKSKVLTGTSIDNIIGTSDKLYSDAEETARNVGVAADKILVGNSIKIKNVDTAGSFDEAARNKFNSGTTVADLREGKSVKIQDVDQAGTLPQNKIAPSSGGTMDLPAITSVDPLDTLEGATGTMDIPALNKVAPSDTLRGSAGTMDIPALAGVDPLDTLEGAAGTMDVPFLANVRNNDTLRGATGGFDAEAWEALRNTLTANGEADVRESETWKYRGTTKTGTLPFQGSDSLIAGEDDEELSLVAE